MQSETLTLIPLLVGVLAGALALLVGLIYARRMVRSSRAKAEQLVRDATQDAGSRRREILVEAQESILARQEEIESREVELEKRESGAEELRRKVERESSELGRTRRQIERETAEVERLKREAAEAQQSARAKRDESHRRLEEIAQLTREQARQRVTDSIQGEAHAEAARLARKIEDEARERAERDAVHLMVQASQRVKIDDVVESTVSFLELPSDEMKGRIIGREGRNIRALEMATGIDLVVDDTPRSVLISSFDPVRREIARVAIDRLVEDGRIHPARIEEVVQKVEEEIDSLIDEKGSEAAFGLGISDLHPKLSRLVGRMRYHTSHGQNLLQHCVETALIGGYMAQEVGARADLIQRAALLHEIGQVQGKNSNQGTLAAAELCRKYGEQEAVVELITALNPDADAKSIDTMLLDTANRMSANRPGARKENLAIFIERLKRLESLAMNFPGVRRAYAVKAGKEIRVIVDAETTNDSTVYELCKRIARTLEKELSYPGQIKVGVVRETRAIRYAL